ncbi:type II secretory pathway component PulJ [Moryella indoligenes]|uniref:Type II secretory pathway component PulJ n=1 Tax=Moryella indoligenes TaxID=371674 RepID=A0AAE4AJY2_9FIRM|nr:DIP1984 family protein [Moryella indoligenes]MDQ0151674.1 type II secretory pathway component PulJ [Moryella indoligenes]
MKLAEALQERADLNRKISQLEERISNNVTVQEGEKTAEDPNELIKELDEAIQRLNFLIAAINLTNCKTIVDGKTLTEWMADRDCLKRKAAAYQEIVRDASNLSGRALHTEIKVICAVNVRDIQKKVDRISKELRLTDNKIQSANWSVELAV